jgi:hypothetical protein
MSNKKMKVSVVEESIYGLYIWLTAEGAVVTDDEGNYLNIEAMKGDERKIKLLEEAAKSMGVPEGGKATFMSGYRRVSDEEYEYQMQRLEWGLIPDELDIAAFKEEEQQLKVKRERGE